MMATCDRCKNDFDSKDGGCRCSVCGDVFCPTCRRTCVEMDAADDTGDICNKCLAKALDEKPQNVGTDGMFGKKMACFVVLFLVTSVLQAQTYTVQATREGLIGGKTASGKTIRAESMFVALPDRSALGKTVVVMYKDKSVTVPVWDVGPHNTIDPYWKGDGVPAAARGKRLGKMAKYGPPKNKAGIDLSDAVWKSLGIPRRAGIVVVSWRFE